MRIPVDSDAAMRTIHRHWEHQQQIVASSSARIATGSRLVSAVDDAAGLAIAERVRSQFEGLRQAGRNAQQGINFVQIADSTLQTTTDLVQRMRVMAVQSANGTYTDTQRSAMQRSVVLTLDELDAIARRSRINDIAVLDGSTPRLRIQVGPNSADVIEVPLRAADHEAVGLEELSVETQEKAVSALDRLDEALEALYAHRAEMAAAQQRMERAIKSLGVTEINSREAHSRIADADLPAETVRMLRAQIASDAGAAMMVQVRQATQLAVDLLLPQISAEPIGGDGEAAGGASNGGAPPPAPLPATGPVSTPESSSAAPVAAAPGVPEPHPA